MKSKSISVYTQLIINLLDNFGTGVEPNREVSAGHRSRDQRLLRRVCHLPRGHEDCEDDKVVQKLESGLAVQHPEYLLH